MSSLRAHRTFDVHGKFDVHRTFDAHRDAVYAWAYRVLRNHHDALDVTQEVFVKWWRAHREGDNPRHPAAWLRRVTVNQSLNLCRARRHETGEKPMTPLAAAVGDDLERREVASAVADALGDMSEQQRLVLFAKTYDGCTFAEIAEQMDLSIPTVKTHYLRALRTARIRLKEAGWLTGDDI
jgi:RNA polymerase sigma-70 factor (ECF subfamily)